MQQKIYTIRQAEQADAVKIVNAEQSIAAVPGFFRSLPSELSEENVIATIKKFKKESSGVYLVAEIENRLIGHAFLKTHSLHNLRHVAALHIAVHIGWQEQGVGKQLLNELIVWAKNSAELKKIELSVRAGNTRAIALYKKSGFQEEGRLKNHVKVGNSYQDDLLMGLWLE